MLLRNSCETLGTQGHKRPKRVTYAVNAHLIARLAVAARVAHQAPRLPVPWPAGQAFYWIGCSSNI
jgi:hypothetical protein